MGASLLVFKNKSDVAGCMTEDDIRKVSGKTNPHPTRSGTSGHRLQANCQEAWAYTSFLGFAAGQHPDPQVAYPALLCHDRVEPTSRSAMGRSGRKGPTVSLLKSCFRCCC